MGISVTRRKFVKMQILCLRCLYEEVNRMFTGVCMVRRGSNCATETLNGKMSARKFGKSTV